MPARAGLTIPTEADRLPLLDLVRGVAVLGILAINLGAYAGPIAASLSPHLPDPGSRADEAWFALNTIIFEGKMRALFTLLFGASLLLFIDRAEARDPGDLVAGERLQLRRLGWLALFGYLHFLLLWWGDILFTYAIAGFAALAFRQARPAALMIAGVTLFAGWHLTMAAVGLPQIRAEERVLQAVAPPAEAQAYARERRKDAVATARELAGYRRGFAAQVIGKLSTQPDEPLRAAVGTLGESLPLMLIGMALFRTGLYAGHWSRRRLAGLAALGIGIGGLLTGLLVAFAWSRHFPPVRMVQMLAYHMALPHLLMALGYLAALILAAPALLRTALGDRLVAAGRMAFSNYLGMTVVMTSLFYGWGLGWVGQVPEHWLWPFLLGGWALMLGWSRPWLARFRHGPLEWLWRCLTYGRRMPLRR
ncbi:DUF418 domain-containing protein [Novosphingobium flavum]|uniref:DUF418 domain-containing protein n=1 Tax=Novosphingobium aerophilum TaxID=2839843 RepID=A0A7X1F642_9SPHN|nr:DUF418 domain-containing protein [Novosphingobium aerophilum]